MNEPQLSAEMEKRFDEVWNSPDLGVNDDYNCDGESATAIKHFLATALEEQKAEYVRKVEELPRDRKITVYDTTKEIVYDKHLISKEKVLAILNGKDV